VLAACGGNSPAATKTSTTTTKPTTSAAPTTTPATTEEKKMQWSSPPQMTIDQNKTYSATIKTNYGEFIVQLLPKDAPLAVNNFVFLARQGFYDGVKFHRIVKGFVVQGGDPTGSGSGSPGYRFADEKITRNYIPGTLAMANSGANTNGSQFFITLGPRPDLDGKHTIFGRVTSGMDVVKKLTARDPQQNPLAPPGDVIQSVVIAEK